MFAHSRGSKILNSNIKFNYNGTCSFNRSLPRCFYLKMYQRHGCLGALSGVCGRPSWPLEANDLSHHWSAILGNLKF